MGLILQIIISSVAVYFAAWLLPGISVSGFGSAVIVAIVLGILNTILKPILKVLSFPITVLTLGLFLLVINTVIVLLASWFVGTDFHVENFWWGLLFSVIVSIVSSVLGSVTD